MLFVFSGFVKDDTEMGCVGTVQYTMPRIQNTEYRIQKWVVCWKGGEYNAPRTQDSYLCGYGQTKREVKIRQTRA